MENFCTTTDKNGNTLCWKIENGKRIRISKKVYQDATGNLGDVELMSKGKRDQHEEWCQGFLKDIYNDLDEDGGKSIRRLKDIEERHGVLEILKNDSSLRISDPINLKHIGPAILIVRRSP